MADLLDEILESPTLSSRPFPRSQPPPTQPATSNIWGASIHPSAARKPNLDLTDLSLSPQLHPRPSNPPSPPAPQPNHYEEEMDWSPSTSQHRAFSSYRPPGPASQGFGQAPTEEKKGAFWYRVPPAPVAPAHRLFNPPNQPRLRNIPASATTNSPEAISFRGADGRANPVAGEDEGRGGVAFAKPSFFPPVSGDDPRNGLADMLQGSFSLRHREEKAEKGSWIGGLFGARK